MRARYRKSDAKMLASDAQSACSTMSSTYNQYFQPWFSRVVPHGVYPRNRFAYDEAEQWVRLDAPLDEAAPNGEFGPYALR